jgi:hypothetical protein
VGVRVAPRRERAGCPTLRPFRRQPPPRAAPCPPPRPTPTPRPTPPTLETPGAPPTAPAARRGRCRRGAQRPTTPRRATCRFSCTSTHIGTMTRQHFATRSCWTRPWAGARRPSACAGAATCRAPTRLPSRPPSKRAPFPTWPSWPAPARAPCCWPRRRARSMRRARRAGWKQPWPSTAPPSRPHAPQPRRATRIGRCGMSRIPSTGRRSTQTGQRTRRARRRRPKRRPRPRRSKRRRARPRTQPPLPPPAPAPRPPLWTRGAPPRGPRSRPSPSPAPPARPPSGCGCGMGRRTRAGLMKGRRCR